MLMSGNDETCPSQTTFSTFTSNYFNFCLYSKYDHVPIYPFPWLIKMNTPTVTVMLLLLCTLFQLLRNTVLQAILSVAVHEKRAAIKITVDHMEILDADVQQGLVGESGPERLH